MEIRVFADVKVYIKTEDILKSNIIYKLEFPNGKIYIGLTTKTCVDRIKCHIKDSFYIKDSGFNGKKARAIRKYMTFNVEILYEGEHLKEKEIEFIEKYDSLNNGLNATAGGDGVNGLSQETIDKIRIGNTGKKRSEETKRNIGNSKRGTKLSEEHKNKLRITSKTSHNVAVYQIDKITDEIINTFTSIADANRFFGKNEQSSNISNCLNNLSKSAFGYKWQKINN